MKGITGLAMLAIVVCGLGVVQAQAPVTDFTYLGVFVVDYQGAEHYLRFFNDATGFMKADATAIDTEAHLSGSIGWNNGEALPSAAGGKSPCVKTILREG